MRIDRVGGNGQFEEIRIFEPLQLPSVGQGHLARGGKVGADNCYIAMAAGPQHGMRIVVPTGGDAFLIRKIARADVGIPDGCLW
jgi:hypothetical protein